MPIIIKSIVLDSNIVIGVLRRDEKSAKHLRKAIQRGYEIIIPEHVKREVNRKIKNGTSLMIAWFDKRKIC